MTQDDVVPAQSRIEARASEVPAADTIDPKQRALAVGLELSKRALEAESLDELFFLLTNDLRILVPFDRALLITHVGGKSALVAASNQPVLSQKTSLYQAVSALAEHLTGVEKAVWLSSAAETIHLPDTELPASARERLADYMKLSGCAFLLGVPLRHNKSLLGHLLLEFDEKSVPNEVQVLTLLSLAPFFASALTEKWLFNEKPDLWRALVPAATIGASRPRALKAGAAALAILGVAALLFLVPVSHTVGGESEVVPRDRHAAFVMMDGLVDRINVREGSRVEKGQVLAILDRRDLDHDIGTAQRRYDILTKEEMLLKRESGQDPSKLAESQLVHLKRKSSWEELKYLKWKAQFLEIKAPVSGIVSTKEVDSLVGKKFKAGEPLCEIAIPGELWAEIFVPEDRVSLVRKGQPATIYLSTEPGTGYPVRVEEIAPIADVLPRLGSTYRVRAPFVNAPEYVKVGMKGVGKIDAGRTNLFDIIFQRLLSRWNKFSIYF